MTSTELDTRTIALSKIAPNPGNVREDVGDVDELAQSIAAQGILQPLVVAPSTTNRTGFVVIIGHRRRAAAQQIGLKGVPCLVRADLDTEDRQIEAMLVENDQRKDLTPVEYGDGLTRLLEYPGYDVKSAANRLGHTQAFVKARLRISKTPPKIRAGISAGQITLEQGLVFADAQEHQDLVDLLEQDLGTNNWEWRVRNVGAQLKERKEQAAALRRIEKAGTATFTETELDEKFGEEAWYTLKALQEDAAEETYAAREKTIVADNPGNHDEQAAAAAVLQTDWDDNPQSFVPDILTDAGHAQCPGHAARVDRGRVDWVCTQAALHDEHTGAEIAADIAYAAAHANGGEATTSDEQPAGDSPSAPAKPKETTAEKRSRLDREQLNEDLLTAADVRLKYLQQRAKAPDTDLVHALAVYLACTALADWRPAAERSRHLLGLPQTLDANDPESRAAQVGSHVADWTVDQLVAAAALPGTLAIEGNMQTGHWYPQMAASVGRLTEVWGHTWSDVERRMLAEAGLLEAAGLDVVDVAGDDGADA